ncbi:MAG TPA: hypothetical protein PLP01_14600 [Phycisphaerae bacterium]|nr:hypothetical protein [Phycisphaerae bacterium]
MPIDDEALAEALIEQTTRPASASADGVSRTSHSIPDQIAGIRFAKTLAAQRRGAGFRMQKLRPPGTVSGL